MMKDYLVYQMMNDFGVDSPLCSFVYITVNGEDWGLYLAVEAVEDSFLARNYGSDTGDLYKPDSMSMGGGRGNGREFDIEEFREDDEDSSDSTETADAASSDSAAASTQGAQQAAEEFTPPDGNTDEAGGGQGGPGGSQGGQGGPDGGNSGQGGQGGPGGGNSSQGGGFNFGSGGMGSDDVKLKYTDDDPDSYSNIFGNAKTDVTDADQERLIAALKDLNEYTNLEETVDIEEVIRYFVVHNFVCNGDSYTGQMIHNYYLHEDDGMLGMIPWDYNLAFGAFQSSSAADSVNESIDEPVSGGDVDDRPMVGWIFSDETYTEQYHELFAEFIERWFAEDSETGHILLADMIQETADLIRPYVEKDPTKFCTAEEFETGVATLTEFVTLRAEAVSRQLEGDSTEVDAGDMDLSDMGSMGNHGGGRSGDSEDGEGSEGGEMSGRGGRKRGSKQTGQDAASQEATGAAAQPAEGGSTGTDANAQTGQPAEFSAAEGGTMPGGMQQGGGPGQMPGDAYGGMQQGGGPGQMPGGAYGQMPGEETPGQQTGTSLNTGQLVGASFIVLAAGILAAFLKKKKV